MDKKALYVVGKLVAEEAITEANEGESLEEYIQRVYPEFENFILNSDNSVISEVADACKTEIRNAACKVDVRRKLVQQWCRVNDPFEHEPPEEATVDEILEFNDVNGSAEELKTIMGEKAFEDYLDRLKTPKRDKFTKTEIDEMREEHYAQHEPAFPSEKTYNHNNGGTTRKYHWQAELQEEFVEDHERFLAEFDLVDRFPQPDDDSEITDEKIAVYANYEKQEDEEPETAEA